MSAKTIKNIKRTVDTNHSRADKVNKKHDAMEWSAIKSGMKSNRESGVYGEATFHKRRAEQIA